MYNLSSKSNIAKFKHRIVTYVQLADLYGQDAKGRLGVQHGTAGAHSQSLCSYCVTKSTVVDMQGTYPNL